MGMSDSEIVQACLERGCCPLGAAMGETGHGPRPGVYWARETLGLPEGIAVKIAFQWDTRSRDTSREESVKIATAAGLRPKIEAFLQGGPARA